MVFDEPSLRFLENESVAKTPASPCTTRTSAFVWPSCHIDVADDEPNVVVEIDRSLRCCLAPIGASFLKERTFTYPWCSILLVDSAHRLYDWIVRGFASKRSCITRSLMKQPRRMHKKKTSESVIWQQENPPRLDCLPCLCWSWVHSTLLSRH